MTTSMIDVWTGHVVKRKTGKVELKQGEEEGRVTAVVSTFNTVDSDGDVVRPTAFSEGQEVPMVWAHNWADPIGKGRINVQPDRAVFDGEFFMDTQRGQEAFKTVRNMGGLQEWSWGFRITDAEIGDAPEGQEAATWWGEGKVQYINGAEVFEVSPVLVGANRETATLEIKSLRDVEEYLKRGARNSRADLDRLISIRDHISELIGEIEEAEDDGKQSEDADDEEKADAQIAVALAEERLAVA